MNSILKKHFSDMYESGRLSHAFLICNTNYDNLKEDLKEILSDYFFGNEINIEESTDIYIIKPENDKITKEAILSLQEVFKTKSQVHDKRVYIIDGVEKMNDYASNSLLKFLEEPEDSIYAILITSNLEKVLSTIKSRCQVLLINNHFLFDLSNFDLEVVDKAIKFVSTYEEYKLDSIAYIYEFISKKEEKDVMISIISIVKNFYYSCLKFLIDGKIEIFNSYKNNIEQVIKSNNETKLINKLLVLNKYENMLEYNLNLNLFLDKLIIDLKESENE